MTEFNDVPCDDPLCVVCVRTEPQRESNVEATPVHAALNRSGFAPPFPSLYLMQQAAGKRGYPLSVEPWPVGVPPPRIVNLGFNLHRCRAHYMGETIDGFGSSPLHAWNACAGRASMVIQRFKPLFTNR
jgi:hypothetical protein